ncbi:MAG: HXXEE domain-containing protein [Ruminococcaceae bacterium]|nr:HXXEE domain-containing protein [Oscillospiraceae bacterium]
MENYIWLFPIIFIFHDMEEVIGFGLWLKGNKKTLGEKYPRILNTYKNFSTEGFSLAVFEELVLCIFFSLLALVSDINAFRFLWLGGFIGCTLHFIIHIGQSAVMKQYIPATITSVICLPVSVWIIYKCFLTIQGEWWYVAALIIVGIVTVAVNLKFAQKLIGWFTVKFGLNPIV